MKSYDVVVIGSGAGMIIVEAALDSGARVALVDKGPLGGTCLNLGCIPSKMLISPADRTMEILNSRKLGIEAQITHIDFPSIMQRMRKLISEDRHRIRQSMGSVNNLDYFEGEGQFISDYTLEVNQETIKGGKIFIAAGARPLIPPVKGIEGIDYLTNETLLDLDQRPESMLIIGGGYIGVEYAHFFSAMGTRVTIVEMGDRLVQGEEPEIAELLRLKMGQRMDIRLNTRALEYKRDGKGFSLITGSDESNTENALTATSLMISAGRRSNADRLKLENTGVEIDKRGFIRVDDYLETSKKHIYALGDILGKQMFTHAANREAVLAWHNAGHEEPVKMDFETVPHAIFVYPQIASVGLTEAEARKNHRVLIGKARYAEVAKGVAMMEGDGFIKAVADGDTRKLLGFHIIGPEASTLIQEVIDIMAAGGDIDTLESSMRIHPAMPEIVHKALANLEEPQKLHLRPERLRAAISDQGKHLPTRHLLK